MKLKLKLKKTIATFLTATIMTALLPSVLQFNNVSADTTKNQSNTYLGVSSISNPNKPASKDSAWSGNYVYFGKYKGNPIKFRVLAKDSTAYKLKDTTTNVYSSSKALFLESDETLFTYNDFLTGAYSQSYYWDDAKVCSGFINTFDGPEKNAIAISYSSYSSYSSNSYEEFLLGSPNNAGTQVFILDVFELTNPSYGYSSDIGATLNSGTWEDGDYTIHSVQNRAKSGVSDWYWIRPVDPNNKKNAGCVYGNGSFGCYPWIYDMTDQGFRKKIGVAPAINIIQDNIIFASSIEGEEDAYKLTILNSNLSVNAGSVSLSGTTISCSATGNGDQLSILITDGAWNASGSNIIYYGAYTGSFDFSSLGLNVIDLGTNYHVYLLAEDINGEKETDYASSPVEISNPSYSVTFNTNGHGTAPISQTITSGGKVTKPADPSASGYTFGGWYTDSACTTVYDFNTAVTSNITLYAKWTAVSSGSGTGSGSSSGSGTGGSSSGGSGSGTTTPAPTPEPIETPKLTTGVAHVQDIGNVGYTTEAGVLTIGTRGMGKRMEEITINFENTTGLSGTLEYRVHVQDYGWMEWVPAGTKCGTEGESKRIEAIEIRFTGDLADYYSVEYCVHIQDYGDMQGWVKDGALAGTTGESKRIEELKIRIVPKHSGSSMSVKYRVHVQDYGWEGAYASNGQMSGTSGESKRLEGIEIFLDGNQYSGGVKFKTHVQDYGWQGLSYDGEMSGTQGEAKRLEGICIELYGEIAEYYDIYYRVHAQDIGWMAWAKNGECAGTAGRSARLEGIQIVLVPKGEPAPGATYEGITAVTELAFKEGF